MTQNKLHKLGNILGLILTCIILGFAFYQQLIDHSLPCPLCLLQRLCFIAVGLCLCMNLMNGIRVSYYGLMFLASLLGLGIALRQIFLHISPGDLGYGSPLLGLYLYTWSAIGFVIIIGLLAISLLFERAFFEQSSPPGRFTFILTCLFLLLILANGISTFLECGPFICKDNPVHYYLFDTVG
ncbi:disulfide bond formation protein B [Legionella hackeliae]|uniref:Inner (Transmembrane) protein n=1 Tax=Legionella hackeliae TaxID=449 RepID=A0A0A8UQ06_LEGHA|nr:disulfide bond formation protein B [Legionella hackeliae]KTD10093.1 transmembrane protein [Legionella hackeliae]CEK09581.1 Inner (Transmembrane) protein [Legionella hackeliae]STX49491.1 inner (transmembrane) protein [Legionella hackeliae]